MNARSIFIAAAILLLGAQEAAAKDVPLDWKAAYAQPQDAKVTVAQDVWNLLAEISDRALDRVIIHDADIVQLMNLLQADGRYDASEIDLMEEMITEESRIISIWPTGNTERRTSLPAINVFRPYFRPILEERWESLWDGGASGWSAYAEAYSRPDLRYVRQRLVGIVAKRMEADWAQSTRENRYAPLRDLLTTLYTATNALPADLQPSGRWLLFLATEQVDRKDADKIPDFLYDWIKPQPV